jgi:hypothetical protein
MVEKTRHSEWVSKQDKKCRLDFAKTEGIGAKSRLRLDILADETYFVFRITQHAIRIFVCGFAQPEKRRNPLIGCARLQTNITHNL